LSSTLDNAPTDPIHPSTRPSAGKFVITKQLTKRLEDYPDARVQPHVQVGAVGGLSRLLFLLLQSQAVCCGGSCSLKDA